jgi:NAD(P)-dependent dehydrogenase (short-subunit alcohol dehydrogenase family)
MKPFSGKAAIVTGATRGIGRAIALELARHGADVAFNYAKSAEAADTLTKEIETVGVRALATQCDVANTEAAAEMVKQVKDGFTDLGFIFSVMMEGIYSGLKLLLGMLMSGHRSKQCSEILPTQPLSAIPAISKKHFRRNSIKARMYGS